ncbi:MAG: bifunctional diaminohydroxyphosphoribosylaminopyrimidine deaminase/5-amino-6-(5-phosphoribosylamino)uracil reductase RibD [Nocardioidaceae bacterium]
MASVAETAAMRRAIELASTPGGAPADPNPRVGAVLLTPHGEAIAEGRHRGAGTPHAEVDALAQAGDRARGGTVVVTLEPCGHRGRTGPCAQALIEAGIARVVFAQTDPNPVATGGADALRAAGIEVEAGVLAAAAAELNVVWSFAMKQRRPFVTWKFAGTLDGRSAASDGTSKWITGAAARADVQVQRARCDTVLIGTGTVAADNPRLTARDCADQPLPRNRQPLRAVMGRRELASSAHVFDDDASTVVLPTRDPTAALNQLFGLDRRHVWLEGGPTLAAAFVTAGLVDQIVAYVAPALLGGGKNAVADLGIRTIRDVRRLQLADVTRVGDDVRLTMYDSERRPASPAVVTSGIGGESDVPSEQEVDR